MHAQASKTERVKVFHEIISKEGELPNKHNRMYVKTLDGLISAATSNWFDLCYQFFGVPIPQKIVDMEPIREEYFNTIFHKGHKQGDLAEWGMLHIEQAMWIFDSQQIREKAEFYC